MHSSLSRPADGDEVFHPLRTNGPPAVLRRQAPTILFSFYGGTGLNGLRSLWKIVVDI